MKIKYIPNPLDKRDRKEFDTEYKFQTIEEYFDEFVKSENLEIDKEFIAPIVTGKKVEWNEVPSVNDEIIFITDLQGKNAVGIITFIVGAIITVVGLFYAPLLPVGISLMAGAVIGMAATLFAPTTETSDDPLKNSQTYNWDSVQNVVGEGNVCPILYGTHLVGGVIIEGFISGNGATGVQENSYLNALMAISEGEIDSIDLSSVRINDTEVKYYSGTVESWSRTGTREQSNISAFSKVVRRYNISGAKLVYGSEYIYQTDKEVDAVKIGIVLTSLFKVDDDGDTKDNSVTFQVKYAPFNDGVEGSSVYVGEYTATDATRSAVYLDIYLNLPSQGIYHIKIKRTTQEFDASTKFGESYLGSMDEIENAALCYPNTALYGVRIEASDKLSGSMPNITVIAKGRKVKDVRNLLAAPAYSNNPANIIYDLLMNKRYGLGRFISKDNIDVQSLIDFADFCDETVTYNQYNGLTGTYEEITEKRFEVNFVFDTEWKASELISKIVGSCRATAFWEGDKFKIVIDKPSTPVQMFNMGNIVDDSYEETYMGNIDVPNQVEAEIRDEEDDYKKVTVTGFDKSRLNEPIVSRTINMFGFTRQSYARRELAFGMRRAKAIKKLITFQTGFEGVICQIGDQVLFQHDTPQYGYGGRIKEISGYRVILDRSVPVVLGNEYRLRIRKADNSFSVYDFIASQTGDVDYIETGHAAVQILGIPEVLPDGEIGDIWAFGRVEMETKPLRVLSISKKEDNLVELSCEEYNESVYYDDETISFSTKNYSQLGLTEVYELDGTADTPQPVLVAGMTSTNAANPLESPPYVLNVALSEKVEVVNGTAISSIVVNFGAVAMQVGSVSTILRYSVIYSKDGGNTWIESGTTTKMQYEIRAVEVGKKYYVLVKPETSFGLTNSIETSEHRLKFDIDITGVAPTPNAVTGFIGSQLGELVRFVWDTNSLAATYEIRMNSWEFGVRIGTSSTNNFSTYVSKTGDVTFYIKAINCSGVYSDGTASCIVNIEKISNINVLIEQDNKANNWSGAKENMTAGSNLMIDDGFETATYYPDMIIFDSATRSKNTVQMAYNAYIASDDIWSDITATWDEYSAVWATSVDTGDISVKHEISTFAELTSEYEDVIRLAGNTTTVKGVEAIAQANVSYEQGTFHEGAVITSDINLQYTFSLEEVYSILFRLTLKDPIATGIIANLSNATESLDFVIFSDGRIWAMSDGSYIEVPIPMSAKNNLRIGLSRTPYLLTITDSAGKKIEGYIKSIGTGETYGSNILSNGDMETGVPPIGWSGGRLTLERSTDYHGGTYALKCTINSSNNGYFTYSHSPSAMALYRVGIWAKNITNVKTTFQMNATGATGYKMIGSSTALSYEQISGHWTASGPSLICGYIYGSTISQYGLVDDAYIEQILTPSQTGVRIVNAPSGSIYNWLTKESDFNYNDSGGYTYSIRRYGETTPIVSGLVSINSMKISALDGYAFVDFGSASILNQYAKQFKLYVGNVTTGQSNIVTGALQSFNVPTKLSI